MQLAPLNLRFADADHRDRCTGRPPGTDRAEPGRHRPGCGIRTPTGASPATCSTSSSSARRPRRRSPAASNASNCPASARGVRSDGDAGTSTPVSPGYTPKSASVGLIQNFAWDLVGSVTAQYVERAPKPAELFSGGGHDATVTFDIGNPNLEDRNRQVGRSRIAAREGTGPLRSDRLLHAVQRLHLPASHRQHLRDAPASAASGRAGIQPGDLFARATRSSAAANSRANGMWCRWGAACSASRTSSTWCARPSPTAATCRAFRRCASAAACIWRDANWLARVNLLHAFAQNDIAADRRDADSRLQRSAGRDQLSLEAARRHPRRAARS